MNVKLRRSIFAGKLSKKCNVSFGNYVNYVTIGNYVNYVTTIRYFAILIAIKILGTILRLG